MPVKFCACGRQIPDKDGVWQCDKCSPPALIITIARKPMNKIRTIAAGACAGLLATALLSACAENWNYQVKSRHFQEQTGRHYIVCKSEFTETYKEVDVTSEVYNLIKVDDTCPAPMSVSPSVTDSAPITASVR